MTAETSERTTRTTTWASSLELQNAQLRAALKSRIVIEQAKGILSERFGIGLDEAFELLRRSARWSRRRIHALAADVTAGGETPPEIERFLASTKSRRAKSPV